MPFTDWPIVKIETRKRRLAVLQYLHEQGRYTASADLIHTWCNLRGIPSTRDQVSQCLIWLEEHHLIDVTQPLDDPIARLTPDGQEVATGSTTHQGVMRPDP